MLDQTLTFIRDTLNQHLQNRLGLQIQPVVLGSLGGDDSQKQKLQNHLVLTLVMLDQETSRQYYSGREPPQGSLRGNPPQFFNIRLLVTANFDDYLEGLKILSEAILFFQANARFDRQTYPTLPTGLSGLSAEPESASELRAFEMWSALGSHYMPSLLYKIRQVIFDDGQIQRQHSLTQVTDVRAAPDGGA